MAASEGKQSYLNNFRGTGASSTISLDFDKLRNAGWTITERKGSFQRTHYKYVSPEGRTQKSAKDVEKKLRDEGTLTEFLKDKGSKEEENKNKSEDADVPTSSCRIPSRSQVFDDDSDYEPPDKVKACESSVKQ